MLIKIAENYTLPAVELKDGRIIETNFYWVVRGYSGDFGRKKWHVYFEPLRNSTVVLRRLLGERLEERAATAPLPDRDYITFLYAV